MGKKIRTEAIDFLFEAILSLENKEECYTFFEDICTINELLSLTQRFEVAKMLREQKTYLEIAEALVSARQYGKILSTPVLVLKQGSYEHFCLGSLAGPSDSYIAYADGRHISAADFL